MSVYMSVTNPQGKRYFPLPSSHLIVASTWILGRRWIFTRLWKAGNRWPILLSVATPMSLCWSTTKVNWWLRLRKQKDRTLSLRLRHLQVLRLACYKTCYSWVPDRNRTLSLLIASERVSLTIRRLRVVHICNLHSVIWMYVAQWLECQWIIHFHCGFYRTWVRNFGVR